MKLIDKFKNIIAEFEVPEEDFGCGEDKECICKHEPILTQDQEQSWMLFWFAVWIPVGIIFCCL